VRDCEPTEKITVETVAEATGMAADAVRERLETLQHAHRDVRGLDQSITLQGKVNTPCLYR